MLPSTIEMFSGPGCPVCVTDQSDMDYAIALAKVPGAIITTFGDLLKCPGGHGRLQEARSEARRSRSCTRLLARSISPNSIACGP